MLRLLINLTDIHPAIFNRSVSMFRNILHIPFCHLQTCIAKKPLHSDI